MKILVNWKKISIMLFWQLLKSKMKKFFLWEIQVEKLTTSMSGATLIIDGTNLKIWIKCHRVSIQENRTKMVHLWFLWPNLFKEAVFPNFTSAITEPPKDTKMPDLMLKKGKINSFWLIFLTNTETCISQSNHTTRAWCHKAVPLATSHQLMAAPTIWQDPWFILLFTMLRRAVHQSSINTMLKIMPNQSYSKKINTRLACTKSLFKSTFLAALFRTTQLASTQNKTLKSLMKTANKVSLTWMAPYPAALQTQHTQVCSKHLPQNMSLSKE